VSAAQFDLPRRLLAEGLGTAFVLATVVGSGIMAERLADGNVALALLANAIPTGAILVVLITVFGPISGAHFNPAVTLCFFMRRAIVAPDALAYVTAQLELRDTVHLCRQSPSYAALIGQLIVVVDPSIPVPAAPFWALIATENRRAS
jgi:Major intrinsic protein